MQDLTLAVLPSLQQADRLTVALRQLSDGGSRLVLTQQSWSEGLGWYNQNSLELSPDQVRELKAALRVETVSATARHSHGSQPGDERPVSILFSSRLRAESA